MSALERIVKELSPEHQRELEDFAVFLLDKQKRKTRGKLRQDWAGGLKEFRQKYTSMELEKKALDWRGD